MKTEILVSVTITILIVLASYAIVDKVSELIVTKAPPCRGIAGQTMPQEWCDKILKEWCSNFEQEL